MSNNLTQTRLDLFYRMRVQKTIPEYVSIRKMKVHDRCASIISTRDGYSSLICPFIKRSHASRSFSYIRCNYSKEIAPIRPSTCNICPMKKIKGTWVPVRTECRDTVWHVMPNNKFWNWMKE